MAIWLGLRAGSAVLLRWPPGGNRNRVTLRWSKEADSVPRYDERDLAGDTAKYKVRDHRDSGDHEKHMLLRWPSASAGNSRETRAWSKRENASPEGPAATFTFFPSLDT